MGLYMSTGKRAKAEWQRILEAHGYACYYCGRSDVKMIREHMFPRRRGGSDELENIVPACALCNSLKGCRTPLEWFLARGEPKVRRMCRLPQRGERPRRGRPAPHNPPHPDAIRMSGPCEVCGCEWIRQGPREWLDAFCADCKTNFMEMYPSLMRSLREREAAESAAAPAGQVS